MKFIPQTPLQNMPLPLLIYLSKERTLNGFTSVITYSERLGKPEKKLIIHELGASNLRAFLSIAFIKQLLVDASSFTRKHDTF